MKQQTEQIEGSLFRIFIHEQDDPDIQLILESKSKGTPLGGTYSFIKHQPHNSTGEYHLHVYDGSNEIFAINKSGTGHDGYHGTRIPNKVYNALVSRFPQWKLPANQIVESSGGYVIAFDFRLQTMRPVRVFRHSVEGSTIEAFEGFFHRFADEPIMTNNGFYAKTIALVETMEGHIQKIAINQFRFTDITR